MKNINFLAFTLFRYQISMLIAASDISKTIFLE